MRLRTTNIWIVLGLLTAAMPSAGQARICQPVALQSCVDDNKMHTDRCLKLYYACGQYQKIIQHFETDTQSDTILEDYYVGVSNFGLAIRNRSQAAKCEYYRSAVEGLQQFLDTVEEDESFRDHSLFEKSYHAVKVLKKIKEEGHCPESGISGKEISRRLREHGKSILESLFLGNLPEDSALSTTILQVRKEIQEKIKSFVNIAAFVDTQLGLRKAAVSGNIGKTLGLCENLQTAFGVTATCSTEQLPGLAMGADALFATTQDLYFRALDPQGDLALSGRLPWITDFMDRLYGELNASSITQYEEARARIVALSWSQLDQTQGLADYALDLIDQDIMGNLEMAYSDLGGEPKTKTTIEALQQDWLDYGTSIYYCGEGSSNSEWYCDIRRCMAGDKRCEADVVQTCSSGSWEDVLDCKSENKACVAGQCQRPSRMSQ